MKGIVLAGGSGTRLFPLTIAVSKQLLPVYDKPMIYYPLSVLMLANIHDILIITTPRDQQSFQLLLGDGSDFGLRISYAVQPSPDGLPQAFAIGRDFIGNDRVALILGDNIFFGNGLPEMLEVARGRHEGATIFAQIVSDPERYGIVELGANHRPISLEEKPTSPKSRFAITGLYFYDNSVIDRAMRLAPSSRGETEITDLNRSYLHDGLLHVEVMGRGFAWLDTGTHSSLAEASNFVEIFERRQGFKIACLEEIAWRKGLITAEDVQRSARKHGSSSYGVYLRELFEY